MFFTSFFFLHAAKRKGQERKEERVTSSLHDKYNKYVFLFFLSQTPFSIFPLITILIPHIIFQLKKLQKKMIAAAEAAAAKQAAAEKAAEKAARAAERAAKAAAKAAAIAEKAAKKQAKADEANQEG